MSEAMSALNGASFNGIVAVREIGLQGMITLRGDLSAAAVQKAAAAACGQDMPGQRKANMQGEDGIAWMSSDELMILVPYDAVEARLDALGDALSKHIHLAVNVSDARAVFELSGGPAVREVIAKLCPVDMSDTAFGPGDFRRTRMAQVPAAFWMPDANSVRIVCFRSVAQYVFDLLKGAAAPGSAVGYLG
ncbi:sarcosine oxidase subunit gamma [Roseovarius pelagicus]|uniref:Sarcosine oxidase subunit gamma n=1 Tax=Roseovarius pelagicus TaxID=2980108 RepID=A0ABY6DH31_9RHOB|nr:sarcosine oxidase subunit gamma family protein [Roseovarius pelagicus]UXX83120.1 sarcosine oxidase subunit gamma [Roseovarius pelagicus]